MDARELRIGNWVHHNKEWSYRNENYNEFDFQWDDSDWYALGESTMFIEGISPIPLTEQWLLDFGWGKGEYDKEHQDNVSMDQCVLAYNVNAGMFTIESHQDIIEIGHIKYVHQLQNIFNSLTGKELTK